MRRIVIVLCLLFLFVGPTFAQDDPTILDVLVENVASDEPAFTVLLQALQTADPSVMNAIADPTSTVTFFAPPDWAFDEIKWQIGEDVYNDLLADPVQLTEFLLYHMLPGYIVLEDITDAIERSNGGFAVRTLSDQLLEIRGKLDEEGNIDLEQGINAGGAPLDLTWVDNEMSNGVFHVIDYVMFPNFLTVANIITSRTRASEPEFTMLLTALEAADPALLDTLSNPYGAVTVFAPTDVAFEALGEETLNALLENPELLSHILSYHLYTGGVAYNGRLNAELPMASGDTAIISIGEEGGVFIDDAELIVTNIEARNGVIHVIDAVIIPE